MVASVFVFAFRFRKKKGNGTPEDAGSSSASRGAALSVGSSRLPAFHHGSSQGVLWSLGAIRARLRGGFANAADTTAGSAPTSSDAPRTLVVTPAGMTPGPPGSGFEARPRVPPLAPPPRFAFAAPSFTGRDDSSTDCICNGDERQALSLETRQYPCWPHLDVACIREIPLTLGCLKCVILSGASIGDDCASDSGVLAFGVAMVAASAATAASVTSTVSKEGNIVVSITGEITEGDAEALKLIIKSANDNDRLVSGVRLNSPGEASLRELSLPTSSDMEKLPPS